MRRGTEVVFFSVCRKEASECIYCSDTGSRRRESERVWAGGEQAEWADECERARV